MGVLEPVKPAILSVQKIPHINPELAGEFTLNPAHFSIGQITVTSDHALFVALDEGTKASEADVAYRHSFYGGARYPSGPLSGEVIGIFSGENPVIIDNALKATVNYLEERAYFYSANDNNSLIFFPHVIGSIGRFLAKETGLPEGESLAYLIAPPMEAMVAFDFALKNSDTRLVKFFKPPTPTNFAGGYLTGSLSDCEAAADAFTQKIIEIVQYPYNRID
jgi:ethanolamine utilization protein EutL